MIEPFYLAAIPDAWEILGVKLRPFSLGHVILLHRTESPFIGAEPNPKIAPFDELALAVLLCSETYRNGLRIIDDPMLPKVLRQWGERLTGQNRWTVRHWLKKAKRIDLIKEATEFGQYIREHSKVPSYDFNPGDFREIHCPSAQMIKVTLMREMGFGEAELLDRCWGLCLWDYVTLSALDGRVKMIDAQSKKEAQELANAVLAKIKSGEVKIPGIR